jgi:hypothetical protein
MHIGGISDSSGLLKKLREKELRDYGPGKAGEGLKCLDAAALAAVEFNPLEQRLRVMTAPYPLKDNNQMDMLEGREIFQKSVDDW